MTRRISTGDGLALRGTFRLRFRNVVTGKRRTIILRNMVVTAGRNKVCQALAGGIDATADIQVNYMAIGSNATAPAASDTQLGTEYFRKAIASSSYGAGIFYATLHLTTTEGVGTIREVGVIIKGTASANSGTLLGHASLNTTKGGSETLDIDYTLTTSNV